jgi:sugar O-acyltransferase (sialic acid O-acetyltransferase NeuD family)
MRPAPLLLVGAGGLGRGVAATIDAVNRCEPQWQVIGYLDDDPSLQATTIGGHRVIGPLEAADEYPDARVAICVASPTNQLARKRVAMRMALDQERLATIVHPAAHLASSTKLGAGAIVLAGTVATTDVTIGSNCLIMPNVTLTHDDVLSDHVVCGGGVALAGEVHVGEGAYLGAGCRVRERRWVGAWALVGMGAVVLDDVPVGQVWAGVPAHYLRSIDLQLEVRT